MQTLTQIQVPTAEQVDEKSQEIFGQLRGQLGMVPNLYATLGYSSNALKNFLALSGDAGKGSFSNKEIEAIKLAVSQENNCVYCKSAHTAIAKMNGFSHEETEHLRACTIADDKLRFLTTFAKQVARNAGHVEEELRDQFFAYGYKERDLIEFISVVIAVTFTNYTHALTQVDVDFPLVNN